MNESLSSSSETIDSNNSQNRILPNAGNSGAETSAIINSEPRPSTSRSVEEHNDDRNISNSSENDLNHSTKRSRIDKGAQKERLTQLHTNGLLVFKSKREVFKSRLTSNAWNRFHLIYDQQTNELVNDFVRCTQCETFVEYNGSTTSNLNNHKCNNRATFLLNNTENIRLFHENDKIAIRDASMKFIVQDIRPFYAMEGDGLIDLLVTMAQVGSRYPRISREEVRSIIPSRKAVRRYTERKAESMKEFISKRLREALEFCGGLACTIDIWTESHTHLSYLGMTAHVITFHDKKIVRDKLVIHCNQIKEATNAKIRSQVMEVFQSYDVQEQVLEDKKITFVSDRGRNIRAALTGFVRLNCYAHLINNLVHSMCDTESAKKIIADANALVRYVNTSTLKYEDTLKKKLKHMCVTRFSSAQLMLRSISDDYDNIYHALQEKEKRHNFTIYVTNKITCLPKDLIEAMNELLEPFSKMIERLEGDRYPTLHMVWPVFRKINSCLQPNQADKPIIAGMKEEGLKYFNLNMVDFEPTLQHKAAVFLHPMLKSMNFAPLNIILDVREFVQNSIFVADHDNTRDTPIETMSTSERANDSIFDEFLDEVDVHAAPALNNELQRYVEFKIDVVSKLEDFDLDKWWCQHESIFPNLFKFYMRINNITSTSCPVERTFSISGRTVEDRRTRLLPSTINTLMLARNMYKKEN